MVAHVSLKKMAEDKENPNVQKLTIFWINPLVLKIEDGFNVRTPGPELNEHIAAMKASFRAGAEFPPLYVRTVGSNAIVVDGHCRTRMFKELIAEGEEIPRVPAIEYTGNDAERVAHMLGTANGKPLTPLEQAHCYLRLMKFGWSRSQIIARSGKSATHVDQALMLANANADVQQMVASGDVSARNAVSMLREHGEETGAFLAPLVAKAKREGKAKVTAKAITGRAIPRKLVDRFATVVGDLFSSLPEESRAALANVESLDTTVLVSASHLKTLLAAHAEMQQLRDVEAPAPAEAATDGGDIAGDPRQSTLIPDAE